MKRQSFFALLLCAFLAPAQAQIFNFLAPAQAQIFKMDNEPNNRIKTQKPANLVTPQLVIIDKEHYVSAAMQMDDYLPLLRGKRVGVVGNQTSIVGETHLVDTLLSLGVDVRKIFTPEHGFRGTADAGAKVHSGKDEKTGLPIVSLYGKNKKPTPEMLQGIDLILFDLQDVGVRFYTYISTMTYVMEAAAENNLPVIVLDRPNPNGFYVDGPVLKSENQSFVGLHQVPVVYGMTIGEYAKMVNGEGWLKNGIRCDLTPFVSSRAPSSASGEARKRLSKSTAIPTCAAVSLSPQKAQAEPQNHCLKGNVAVVKTWLNLPTITHSMPINCIWNGSLRPISN